MSEFLGEFVNQSDGRGLGVWKFTEEMLHTPLSGRKSIHLGSVSYRTSCGQDLNLAATDESMFELVISGHLVCRAAA